MKRRLLIFFAGTQLFAMCVSAQLNNADRLIARPDFPAARAAAPEWCRDALKTINQLEAAQESQ